MNNLSPFHGTQVRDHNFGMLPPIAEAVAKVVCAQVTDADPQMVRTHLLSVLSSAVAPLFSVTPPTWSPIPIGVNTMCITNVGGSKSPVHDRLIQSLQGYTAESFPRFESAQIEFNAQSDEHKFQIQIVKKELARRIRKGESAGDLTAELAMLNRTAPKSPKHRPRLAGNLDLESMLRQLDGDNEVIDFLLGEGYKFLDSSLMRHLPDLIDLMDGKPLAFRREKKKHLHCNNPSGTFGLMAQFAAVEPFRPQFKNKQYGEHKAVTLGFFARFLICVAEPMPFGNQYLPGCDDDATMARFHTMLRAHYDRHRDNQEAGATARIELSFAPDAVGYWNELCRIVNNLKRGQLSHIADYASKMLNMTARLAAVLHVWESETHYVSTSCLQRAWELVYWHSSHYERTFVPPPPSSQQEADVAAVVEHLNANRLSLNCEEVPTEPLGLLLGIPNHRMRAALLRMEQRDLIELCDGKTTFINCQKMFSRSRNITWR